MSDRGPIGRRQTQIVELADDADAGWRPYGACEAFWKCKDPEVLLAGPAETGKTLTALHKLDALCRKYDGARALMVRKYYSALKESAVVTFDGKVLGAWNRATEAFDADLTDVRKYGGDSPKYYDYPNGSRIVLSGMDTGGGGLTRSKVLSAEYDFIYINQLEELAEEEYEILTTRCTGRAGNAPYAQILADCNPSHPLHWILKRAEAGHLTLFKSEHTDNPTLYDPKTGALTEQGKRTMGQLDRLTGTRKLRLKDGLWVSAEGAIYPEFDPSVHVINRYQLSRLCKKTRIPYEWKRYRVIDFGYTNPATCQWWAEDPDGRLYMYREIYQTRMLITDFAQKILRHSHYTGRSRTKKERYVATICDHDAQERAQLNAAGIETTKAYKKQVAGIHAVKQRFELAGDDRPRIYLLSDALIESDVELELAKKPTCLKEEIPGYIWKDHEKKDEPVEKDDHGCDAMRYIVAHVDDIRKNVRRPARRTGTVQVGGVTY